MEAAPPPAGIALGLQSAPTFYPGLEYRDADAGMNWLESTLGSERREDHRDDNGNVVHAELEFGGAIVMLSTAGVGREPFRSLQAGGRLVYRALNEVDSLYERVRASGADIAVEITDTAYGSRDFTVRDPEGSSAPTGHKPRADRLPLVGLGIRLAPMSPPPPLQARLPAVHRRGGEVSRAGSS